MHGSRLMCLPSMWRVQMSSKSCAWYAHSCTRSRTHRTQPDSLLRSASAISSTPPRVHCVSGGPVSSPLVLSRVRTPCIGRPRHLCRLRILRWFVLCCAFSALFSDLAFSTSQLDLSVLCFSPWPFMLRHATGRVGCVSVAFHLRAPAQATLLRAS
jgi:hypothetical protein